MVITTDNQYVDFTHSLKIKNNYRFSFHKYVFKKIIKCNWPYLTVELKIHQLRPNFTSEISIAAKTIFSIFYLENKKIIQNN